MCLSWPGKAFQRRWHPGTAEAWVGVSQVKNGLPVKVAVCAKARSNRAGSMSGKRTGALQDWRVVRGGARKEGRGQITQDQVCTAQKSRPSPEAVGKGRRTLHPCGGRTEDSPVWRLSPGPGASASCPAAATAAYKGSSVPNKVQISDPDVLFCRTSRML